MRSMRTEHDPHHKASSKKLDEASSQKKECAFVRRSLRKYLHGHLFMPQKIRIERHLASCVVCSSEYQSLRQERETRRLLKDVTPPQGLIQHVKEGVSALATLKKLLYRPLWMVAIVGIVVLAAVAVNVASRRRDQEIENLEKSLPPASSPVAPASAPPAARATLPAQPAAVPPPAAQTAAPQPAATAPVPPLVIIVRPANDDAVRRINEVMRGYGSLRNLAFSGSVREISGSLPGKELPSFFSQIESTGKVAYSRKKSELIPGGQPVPFIMKLKPAPAAAAQQPAAPAAPKAAPAAETTAQPASAPTQTTLP
jgi:hypothetical protein